MDFFTNVPILNFSYIDEVQAPLGTLFKTRYQACVAESAFLVTSDKGFNHPSSAGNNNSLPCSDCSLNTKGPELAV